MRKKNRNKLSDLGNQNAHSKRSENLDVRLNRESVGLIGERALTWITTAFRLKLIAIGALFILIFLWMVIVKRLSYPFELEWLEGESVGQVQRIMNGQPLYVSPSLEFVPFIYTPLYFYVAAFFSHFIGLGFFSLRLVSFLSSLVMGVLIFWIVRSRTQGSFFWGFLATGFMFASFQITGAWFDLARVDSFFLFLLLSSIFSFQIRSPIFSSILSPALMFLAFFTKQNAIFLALPLAVWSIYFRRGYDRLLFSIVFFSAVLLSTVIMNKYSDGWYSFYVFSLPSEHAIIKTMLIHFWNIDLFSHAGIACCFSAFYFLHGLLHKKLSDWSLDAVIFGGMLMASYSSRLHSGGTYNSLFPVYAVLAIYFCLGMSSLVQQGQGKKFVEACVYSAAVIQFLTLFYFPDKLIPTPVAEAQGEKVLETLAGIQGDVFMPYHPWYPAMVGKTTFAHGSAMWDVQRASPKRDEAKAKLAISILHALSEKRFGAVVIDANEFPMGTSELEENYVLVNTKLSDEAFNTLTSEKVHPRLLFFPRSPQTK